MMDGIIKADGTSRLMRSTLPATYEEFRAQCAAGTQPLDVLFNAIGWSQLPTFLNKGNLARDNTLALFGLSASAVPDDVLRVLSRFQKGLGNEYFWAKYGVTYEPVWGAAENCYFVGTSGITTSTKPTLTLYNSLSYAEGAWILSDTYKTITVSTSNITSVLSADSLNVGVKYFKDASGNVWKTTPGVSRGSYGGSDNVWTPYIVSACRLTGTAEIPNGVSYVNSPDPNAYPIDDGYTYSALGQLGAKVQIATGSYTGTGTYGASNPNSLTFDFVPKLVIVAMNGLHPGGYSTQWASGSFIWTHGQTSAQKYAGNSTSLIYLAQSGNSLSWYNTTNSNGQCNDSGGTYYYIAIG